MKKILFFHICLTFCVCNDALYTKVELQDPSALCLDGSAAAYYISKGQDENKVLLYFEDGGWCRGLDQSSAIEDCYERSFTDSGSSKAYPETLTFSDGILSNQPQNNFKSYTKIILKYCDGSGHQGSRSQPISYKGVKLYFRGNNITLAQLNSLENQISLYSSSSSIIVSGTQAGAVAAFQWADTIKRKSSTTNIFLIPDCGIFLDSPNIKTKTNVYKQQITNMFKLSNNQSNPPTSQCVKIHPTQPELCMFVQNLLQTITTQVFAIQSLYQQWSIKNILGINCIVGNSLQKCSESQFSLIEQYHQNLTKVLNKIMQINDKNGYWAPVCANTNFTLENSFDSEDYRIPQNSQNSVDVSVYNWITHKIQQNAYLDLGKWPSNKPCSGIKRLDKLNLQNQ